MLRNEENQEKQLEENLDQSKGPIQIVTRIPRDLPICIHKFRIFRGILGIEAQCERCGTGYIMTPGTELKEDGHIYLHGTRLI